MSANPAVSAFIDTNVLVYGSDVAAGQKHRIAKLLILETWAAKRAHLSIQVLQEFYYNVTRKIPLPLQITEAQELVRSFSVWQVHIPDTNDVLAAIDLQAELGTSFWDAMILQSAFALGCDTIYSEDFDPGRSYRGIKVVNPFV
ncbi:MAG: PIN domain-containing protein [Anaerolineales bacterium]|nr:PIN domain-containing protein [Anaerolineales bacterium]